MLSYLWSLLSGPTSPAAPEEAPHLSEQQLHAVHVEWTRMQERNRADADALLGKLVEENNQLVGRLDGALRELKDVKAGRKADEEALKAAQKEVAKLGGGKFAPAILNSSRPGRAAVEGLIGKLRESLLHLPSEEQRKDWQFLVFVFCLDSVHPSCTVILNDLPKDLLRQRQRAFATTFARDSACHRLLLGRWVLADLAFAEEVVFTAASARSAYPEKIVFAEPQVGARVPPQIRRLEPKILRISSLLRRHPLDDLYEQRPLLQLDYTRPLSHQKPQLCLDHYLSPTRCSEEHCTFSHDYEIPNEVIEALRACHFAHPPSTPTLPIDHTAPTPTAPTFYRPPQKARTTVDQSAPTPADLVAAAAAPPSSTRSDLPKLLSSPQKAAAALPGHAASPKRHEIAPNSPFAHPLSLAGHASSTPDFDAVKLTDAELESMLAKAKVEEAEYAKGLQEDPFWEGLRQGGNGMAAGGARAA
ncbi:zinc finger, CCCH-type domain containing protein [Rhodotorula toruloides]|uniref:Zinc finger, CCCH-type domain containing protein n=1 Tax=Rhodotorula toruloides TaxID=5286 RepID=A0A511KMR3_RHOTO|nr:zinc finger, CCCH-type domain containing protein [Rhodotorula toruloides]